MTLRKQISKLRTLLKRYTKNIKEFQGTCSNNYSTSSLLRILITDTCKIIDDEKLKNQTNINVSFR